MAVNYAFDVNDAVSINPELDHPVGYLTTANFFGDALSADLEVSNPLAGAFMPVVAIMSNIQWGQTASANLSMQAYVSMENWSRLRAMTQMALTNTALTLN